MSEPASACSGCGACCQRVGFPPYWNHAGKSDRWLSELLRSHPELAAEVRQAAATERREQDLPCTWLDPTTQCCRHYDLRPQICRDFELGSPKCLELRWLRGLGSLVDRGDAETTRRGE